jgi:hypothetical protein
MLQQGQKVIVKLTALRHYSMKNVGMQTQHPSNQLHVGNLYFAEWYKPYNENDEDSYGYFQVGLWCIHISDVELIEIVKE